MRMGIRRFTRLTNEFSKKLRNHAAAVNLHFFYMNWGARAEASPIRIPGRRRWQRGLRITSGRARRSQRSSTRD